jgi:hypothetical protein
MRRIGALMNLAADDVEGQQRLAAFLQGPKEVSWEVGCNVRIDIRSATDIELNSKYAMELLVLAPNVFLAAGAPTVRTRKRLLRWPTSNRAEDDEANKENAVSSPLVQNPDVKLMLAEAKIAHRQSGSHGST